MELKVTATDNLQAVLNAANPGDSVLLEDNFAGNFILPVKPDGPSIAIYGERGIFSPNALPALRTAPGAKNWDILQINFHAKGINDIVRIGDIQTLEQVPRNITFDSCSFDGGYTVKRGLAMNGGNIKVHRCTFKGIGLPGQESQAIACWNGPGPFEITDNHIEPGSIGVLFGGAAPSIQDLVPTGITFKNNIVSRPLSMRTGAFGVKNLFELKNARDVVISDNLFENNWAQAQSGWGITMTVRAHGAPWSTIENVLFEKNTFRHSGGGFNILGQDDTGPSGFMNNVVIRENLISDINPSWGGNGALFNIAGSPRGLDISYNIAAHSGNIISVGGLPVPSLKFIANYLRHNSYGIIGTGTSVGNGTITKYFPNSQIIGNTIVGGKPTLYPANNFFPPSSPLDILEKQLT